MLGSPLLPIFGCLGPAIGLIGFVLLMIGVSSRQENTRKWGIAILTIATLGVAISLGIAALSSH